jgi:hypothetical protein
MALFCFSSIFNILVAKLQNGYELCLLSCRLLFRFRDLLAVRGAACRGVRRRRTYLLRYPSNSIVLRDVSATAIHNPHNPPAAHQQEQERPSPLLPHIYIRLGDSRIHPCLSLSLSLER